MKHFFRVILAGLVAALASGCHPPATGRFQGYIEGEYVYVASPLAGALTTLAVARGDTVKPGQPLFELEHLSEAAALAQSEKNLAQAQAQLADLQKGRRPSEIASLEAQLARAQAELQLSASQLARRQQLDTSAVVAKEELDQARAQQASNQAWVDQLAADLMTARLGGREDALRAAQAAVDAQAAACEKSRWALDQKRQVSPAAAQVHDTLYRPGEFVAAGSPVAVLLPPANLKVRFFVPQDRLPSLHIGQTVTVECDGATQPLIATVNYISTQAEYTPPVIYSRETRASLVFMVEARFAPADAAALRPGQPADVMLK